MSDLRENVLTIVLFASFIFFAISVIATTLNYILHSDTEMFFRMLNVSIVFLCFSILSFILYSLYKNK
jgi:cation transporter-like permease